MTPKHRKVILISVKVALAAVLLTWVLGKVHWRNYVVTRAGQSLTVIRPTRSDGKPAYEVSVGRLWWKGRRTIPAGELEPLDGQARQVVRMGFASSLKRLRVGLLIAAAISFLLCLLITAVRWWTLLRIQQIDIRLWETVRLTFLGQFFNYVVLGTVGGDLVKAYYVSKHTPNKAAVLVSVFVDRAMGFTELALLASVMILVLLAGRLASFEQMRSCAIALAILLAGLGVALTFLFSPRLRRALRLQKLYRRLPIARQIEAAGNAMNQYRRRWSVLLGAVAISFVAHLFFVGAILLMGRSLSLDVPWHSYFVYVPLIYIAGALPLSPGGVGVIETLFQTFFVSAVCGPSEVLALALLARIIPMLWAAPGVVVAVTGPKLPRTEVLEAELGIEHAPEP